MAYFLGLRDDCGLKGRTIERRRETTSCDRASSRSSTQHTPFGRGNVGTRQHIRADRAGRARSSASRSHVHCHSSPPIDHSECAQDYRGEVRSRARRGHSCRAHE